MGNKCCCTFFRVTAIVILNDCLRLLKSVSLFVCNSVRSRFHYYFYLFDKSVGYLKMFLYGPVPALVLANLTFVMSEA